MAADGPAANPPATDRELIIVTPRHTVRPSEWETMQAHANTYRKLKERFDPDPRPLSAATQGLDDVLDQRPTGQKEPEIFRAVRDGEDMSAGQ